MVPVFDSIRRYVKQNRGANSLSRCHLTSIEIAIVEIRRSYDRLISAIGYPILVRHLCCESGPCIQTDKLESPSLYCGTEWTTYASVYLTIIVSDNGLSPVSCKHSKRVGNCELFFEISWDLSCFKLVSSIATVLRLTKFCMCIVTETILISFLSHMNWWEGIGQPFFGIMNIAFQHSIQFSNV